MAGSLGEGASSQAQVPIGHGLLSKLITIQVSLLGGSARRWQGGVSGEGSQALVWIDQVVQKSLKIQPI